MAHHPRMTKDYGYTHWVGQFAIYALTDGLVD